MADGYTTREGNLTTSDGATLYTKTWIPADQPPRARLAFVHGFSDHCNFYETLFIPLARQGIQVHSFDQRGWGRSVSSRWDRGRSGPTAQVLSDITHFLRSLDSPSPSPPSPPTSPEHPAPTTAAPLFLMGHSMGGAEVLVYAATGPPEIRRSIRGYLAESPFVALHPRSRPWKLTVLLGRAASRVLPSAPLVQKLEPTLICRDPDVVRRYVADPLCHDTGTLAGLAGMLDRAADLEDGRLGLRDGDVGGGAGQGRATAGSESGKTRLWIGHGTADGICDFNAARAYFERAAVADKEMRVYEGWYHKLHMEPGEDKVVFAEDVAKWILDRSGPLESLPTAERAKL